MASNYHDVTFDDDEEWDMDNNPFMREYYREAAEYDRLLSNLDATGSNAGRHYPLVLELYDPPRTTQELREDIDRVNAESDRLDLLLRRDAVSLQERELLKFLKARNTRQACQLYLDEDGFISLDLSAEFELAMADLEEDDSRHEVPLTTRSEVAVFQQGNVAGPSSAPQYSTDLSTQEENRVVARQGYDMLAVVGAEMKIMIEQMKKAIEEAQIGKLTQAIAVAEREVAAFTVATPPASADTYSINDRYLQIAYGGPGSTIESWQGLDEEERRESQRTAFGDAEIAEMRRTEAVQTPPEERSFLYPNEMRKGGSPESSFVMSPGTPKSFFAEPVAQSSPVKKTPPAPPHLPPGTPPPPYYSPIEEGKRGTSYVAPYYKPDEKSFMEDSILSTSSANCSFMEVIDNEPAVEEGDPVISKTILLHSPVRQEPIQVNIDVCPQPLVATEDGERFLCDFTLDMHPAAPEAAATAAPVPAQSPPPREKLSGPLWEKYFQEDWQLPFRPDRSWKHDRDMVQDRSGINLKWRKFDETLKPRFDPFEGDVGGYPYGEDPFVHWGGRDVFDMSVGSEPRVRMQRVARRGQEDEIRRQTNYLPPEDIYQPGPSNAPQYVVAAPPERPRTPEPRIVTPQRPRTPEGPVQLPPREKLSGPLWEKYFQEHWDYPLSPDRSWEYYDLVQDRPENFLKFRKFDETRKPRYNPFEDDGREYPYGEDPAGIWGGREVFDMSVGSEPRHRMQRVARRGEEDEIRRQTNYLPPEDIQQAEASNAPQYAIAAPPAQLAILATERPRTPDPRLDKTQRHRTPEPRLDKTQRLFTPELRLDKTQRLRTPEPPLDKTQRLRTPEPRLDKTQRLRTPEPRLDKTQRLFTPEPRLGQTQRLGTPEPCLDKTQRPGTPDGSSSPYYDSLDSLDESSYVLSQPTGTLFNRTLDSYGRWAHGERVELDDAFGPGMLGSYLDQTLESELESEDIQQPGPSNGLQYVVAAPPALLPIVQTERLRTPSPRLDKTQRLFRTEPRLGQTQRLRTPAPRLDKTQRLFTTEPRLGQTQRLRTPEPRLDKTQRLFTPEPRLGQTQRLGTPEPRLGQTQRLGTPEQRLGQTQRLGTPEPRLGQTQRLGTPGPRLGQTQRLGTPEPRLGQTQRLGTPEPRLGQTQRLGTPEQRLGQTQRLGTPEQRLGQTQRLGTPESRLGQTQRLGSPEPRLGQTQRLGTPEQRLGQTQRLGTPDGSSSPYYDSLDSLDESSYVLSQPTGTLFNRTLDSYGRWAHGERVELDDAFGPGMLGSYLDQTQESDFSKDSLG